MSTNVSNINLICCSKIINSNFGTAYIIGVLYLGSIKILYCIIRKILIILGILRFKFLTLFFRIEIIKNYF